MSASILDGRSVASIIQNNLKKSVTKHLQSGNRAPSLAVILVGDDPASHTYVNHKRHACAELGFRSLAYNVSKNITEKELLSLLEELNVDIAVDGILVQLPLPAHINKDRIIESINPSKDVDGFHPYNFGKLAQGNPYLRPCTPLGIIELLNYYKIPLVSKHAVIVGASNIVGRPMALEFLLAKSTVTICHQSTINLEQHVRNADILVVATGKPDIINPEWLHKDLVLVDVGIHRLQDGALRGDIDFKRAKERVAWITPVPGGVGPMTISMLLHNTLLAARIIAPVK